MSERRIKAIVEYDGQCYAGFQRQPGAGTIQGALESAIQMATGGLDVRVSGAGRTDSGAHATGQVISFVVNTRLDDSKLLRAINAHLPSSIALQSLVTSAPSFDPRRSARSREYRYLVLERSTPAPLWRGRALQVRQALDLDKMRVAATALLGVNDFSAFAAPSGEMQASGRNDGAVRTLFVLDVAREDELVTFRLVGNGFLQHMIRTIVGTLLLVGQGKLDPDRVRGILVSRDRSLAGPPVPADGLYLVKVNYGENN